MTSAARYTTIDHGAAAQKPLELRGSSIIYLDYAADTPACEAALAAFADAARNFAANPNAMHAMGQAARTHLNAVTESLAGMLGVLPDEVVLTSGATEANNMAILGLARAYRSRGSHVITTPMEHASVTAPVMALKAEGFAVDFAAFCPMGRWISRT